MQIIIVILKSQTTLLFSAPCEWMYCSFYVFAFLFNTPLCNNRRGAQLAARVYSISALGTEESVLGGRHASQKLKLHITSNAFMCI